MIIKNLKYEEFSEDRKKAMKELGKNKDDFKEVYKMGYIIERRIENANKLIDFIHKTLGLELPECKKTINKAYKIVSEQIKEGK